MKIVNEIPSTQTVIAIKAPGGPEMLQPERRPVPEPKEGEVLIRRVEHARGDYLSKLAAHQDALATVVRRVGWQFDRHRTDRSPESALLALYMGLSGMRGGRR